MSINSPVAIKMRMEKTPTASFSIVEWREDILKKNKKNKNRVSDTIKWRHRWNRRAKFPVCAAHIIAAIWREKKCYNKEKKKARERSQRLPVTTLCCRLSIERRNHVSEQPPSLLRQNSRTDRSSEQYVITKEEQKKKEKHLEDMKCIEPSNWNQDLPHQFYFFETTDNSYTVYSKRTG